MKFNELNRERWTELQPYLDTCILPLTGLTGHESPVEMAQRLEQLRDALDLLEIPYKGRMVTLPAIQYMTADGGAFAETVNRVAAAAKQANFRYVIAVTCEPQMVSFPLTEVDLLLVRPMKVEISDKVNALWRKTGEDFRIS
jgi:23S rRNA (pseudouridine1915-N3)-methyltransferase